MQTTQSSYPPTNGENCHHEPSYLPLDLSYDLSSNLAIVKAGVFQPTSVLTNIAIKEYFPKRYGEFTDVFVGETYKAADTALGRLQYQLDANTDQVNLRQNYVAIKYVRPDSRNRSAKQRVISTLTAAKDKWSSLCHPNISPVWSLTSHTEPVPAVVMPWFDNGNILKYTQKNVAVDRLDIVKQIASAIAYIHTMGEVHANIIPMNVMIMDDGRACLSDTGLNIRLRQAMYSDIWPVPSSWMFKAPEELDARGDPSFFKPTKAMDTYAFASTAYNIFTSNPPVPSYPYGRGIRKIMGCGLGHNLQKPEEISGPLWDLLVRCWSVCPEDRPLMADVEVALLAM